MTDIRWQKSSYSSEGNNCVELGSSSRSDGLLLRESTRPSLVLSTDRKRLEQLLTAVRAGKLDLA